MENGTQVKPVVLAVKRFAVWSNMQLADDVSFEIYFEKIGEIKLPKNHSGIFL